MGLALALRMFDARMHARSKRLKTVSQVLTGQYACLNWIAMALIADELMVPLGEQTKVGIKCAAARDLPSCVSRFHEDRGRRLRTLDPDSTFEDGDRTELVVLFKESDGTWRCGGYAVNELPPPPPKR